MSDDLQEEFHSPVLHEKMNVYRLRVHSQHEKQARAKRKSKDSKRARYFYGGSSKNRLDIQDKNRLKKRVSNQVISKFPQARYEYLYNIKSKKVRGTSSPKISLLSKCGKGHVEECLV